MTKEIDYKQLFHNIVETVYSEDNHGWKRSAAVHAQQGYDLWVERALGVESYTAFELGRRIQ